MDQRREQLEQLRLRAASLEPGLLAAWGGALSFGLLFGYLAIRQHNAFGTQAFDLGIYDQGFWLVSRGQSFDTVRGLHFWGHHLNLIAFAYAPFYWLGAGARFLLGTQAFVLGLGAVPVYLVASRRLDSEPVGVLFAISYLLYPPVQWLTHANFHPEALAITPLLFGAWFGFQRRWRPFWISVGFALAMREEVALVLFVAGCAMVVASLIRRRWPASGRRDNTGTETATATDTGAESAKSTASSSELVGASASAARHSTATAAAATSDDQSAVTADASTQSDSALDSGSDSDADSGSDSDADSDADSDRESGPDADPVSGAPRPRRPWTALDQGVVLATLSLLYYLVAINVVLPYFNRWNPPFYFRAFYGDYGSSGVEVVISLAKRPDRLFRAAAEPETRGFYNDLFGPWGWLPIAGPLALLPALPQLIGSTIANIPYPRSIRYQYTSLLIAPIVIAAIEGAALIRRIATRFRFASGAVALAVMLTWMSISMAQASIDSSPAPWSSNAPSWMRPTSLSDAYAGGVAVVPDGESVSAQYTVLAHVAHRSEIYTWPNPWIEENWGIDDRYNYPNPSTVDWVIVNLPQLSAEQLVLWDAVIATDFEVVYDVDGVVVAHRRDPG